MSTPSPATSPAPAERANSKTSPSPAGQALRIALKVLSAPRLGWRYVERSDLGMVDFLLTPALLAAMLPALAFAAHLVLFGVSGGPYGNIAVPTGTALLLAAVAVPLFLGGALGVGLAAGVTAPKFGGRSDASRGMRLALLSVSPLSLAFVLWAIPGAWWLLALVPGLLGAAAILIPGLHQELFVSDEQVTPAAFAIAGALAVTQLIVLLILTGAVQLVLSTRAAYWP